MVERALFLSASGSSISKRRQNIEPSFNASGCCVPYPLPFADG
jgi:hypothetical protein